MFTNSVDIMKLTFSITFLIVIISNSFSQSSNDILNLLILNKTISQQQADSVRAEAALLQQSTDAARKSFFISAARQMQLTGYSQIRYQLFDEKDKRDGFRHSSCEEVDYKRSHHSNLFIQTSGRFLLISLK